MVPFFEAVVAQVVPEAARDVVRQRSTCLSKQPGCPPYRPLYRLPQPKPTDNGFPCLQPDGARSMAPGSPGSRPIDGLGSLSGSGSGSPDTSRPENLDRGRLQFTCSGGRPGSRSRPWDGDFHRCPSQGGRPAFLADLPRKTPIAPCTVEDLCDLAPATHSRPETSFLSLLKGKHVLAQRGLLTT